jgi:hypothetical protein
VRRAFLFAAVVAAVAVTFGVGSTISHTTTLACVRSERSTGCDLVRKRWFGGSSTVRLDDVTTANVVDGLTDSFGTRDSVVVIELLSGRRREIASRSSQSDATAIANAVNAFVGGRAGVRFDRTLEQTGVLGVVGAATLFGAFVGLLVLLGLIALWLLKERRRSTLPGATEPRLPAAPPAAPPSALPAIGLAAGWSAVGEHPWGTRRMRIDWPTPRLADVALPEPVVLRIEEAPTDAPRSDGWEPARLHLIDGVPRRCERFRLMLVLASRAVTTPMVRATVLIEARADDGRVVARSQALICTGYSPFELWCEPQEDAIEGGCEWRVRVEVAAADGNQHSATVVISAAFLRICAEGIAAAKWAGYHDAQSRGVSHADVLLAARDGFAHMPSTRPLDGYCYVRERGPTHDDVVMLRTCGPQFYSWYALGHAVEAGATTPELLDLFTNVRSSFEVEGYPTARQSASHTDIMEAAALGGSVRRYGAGRRIGISHADLLDAIGRGIDLAEYALGRVRTFGAKPGNAFVPISHAEVVEAHEAGVWVSAYGVGRCRGHAHGELLAAHAQALSIGEYTRARSRGATHVEVMADPGRYRQVGLGVSPLLVVQGMSNPFN